MSHRVLLSLIGALLMVTSRSPVAVSFSGITLHFPVLVIAAAAVALACLAGALLAVRALHGALRPRYRSFA